MGTLIKTCTLKYVNIQTLNNCCKHSNIKTQTKILQWNNASKMCRRNSKQCRPRSDCSSTWSTLFAQSFMVAFFFVGLVFYVPPTAKVPWFSLIRKTGEALFKLTTPVPSFTRRIALPLHHRGFFPQGCL